MKFTHSVDLKRLSTTESNNRRLTVDLQIVERIEKTLAALIGELSAGG